MELTNEIKEILENVVYWETCPQDYKDKINTYLKSENETALNIDIVSHYYLVEGDTINRGDEFQCVDGDNSWRITGQENNVFTGKKHYPHRRKL